MKIKLKTLEQIKKEFEINGSKYMLYFPKIGWYMPEDIFTLLGKNVTICEEKKIYRGVEYYKIMESSYNFPVVWFEPEEFIDESEFKI